MKHVFSASYNVDNIVWGTTVPRFLESRYRVKLDIRTSKNWRPSVQILKPESRFWVFSNRVSDNWISMLQYPDIKMIRYRSSPDTKTLDFEASGLRLSKHAIWCFNIRISRNRGTTVSVLTLTLVLTSTTFFPRLRPFSHLYNICFLEAQSNLRQG